MKHRVFIVMAVLALSLVGGAQAAGTNLISNPSVETVNPSNTALPLGWQKDKYSITASFAYQNTGQDGTRSVATTVTATGGGDAKWYPTQLAVKPSTSYTYCDYYISNVATEMDAWYTATGGGNSYPFLKTIPAASSWTQACSTFTTPANVAKMTVFHLIFKVGKLQVDNVSLVETNATPPPAPTVSLTNPANNATVQGTVNLTANATNAASVQFKVGSSVIGTDTTSPYSVSWDSTTVTNAGSPYTVTATATNTTGSAASTASITVNNPTPPPAPTVSVTSPTSGQSVAGTVALTANATDATSVQFKVDGTAVGTDTTSPYSVSWNSTTVSNSSHSVTATATNTTATVASTPVSFTVNNVAPAPTVSITAPASGATVSGSVPFSADTGTSTGVTSVAFKVDGTTVGTDTTSPYSISWDTTTASNVGHTLTATVTTTGGTANSSPVNVTVSNVAPPPPGNLVPNPSVETQPNWSQDAWGTNTHAFTWLNTGHTGSHSLQVSLSGYTNGDAKWDFPAQTVTPGQNYDLSVWYESSVPVEIDVLYYKGTTAENWDQIKLLPAAATWTKATGQWLAPAGATTALFNVILGQAGTLTTDDYSMSPATSTSSGFTRGLVSVTIDDGWQSQYNNGLPILTTDSIPATMFIISGEIGDTSDYMTQAQIQAFQNQGSEIGSHTVTHPHLNTLAVGNTTTPGTSTYELYQSQQTLQSDFGGSVVDFASPYGEANATVLGIVKQYYATHRGVQSGFNDKSNFDPYNLLVQNIDSTTSTAQVQAWVDQAASSKSWLILVYHEIGANIGGDIYHTDTAAFSTEMAYIHNDPNITPVTIRQGMTEVTPQLP